MKRAIYTFLALTLTIFAIGCSQGGGAGGAKKDDKGGNTGGAGNAGGAGGNGAPLPAGATRPTGISANLWCFNDNAQGLQTRLNLGANGSAHVDQFELTAAGRGGKLGETDGTWFVENNSTIVYAFAGGPEQREAVRLDPSSAATGAPQLIFGTAPQTTAYDPCN